MQEAENTKVVQDAYAAFGRNDIPTLMTHVADDIVWVNGNAVQVPSGQWPQRGMRARQTVAPRSINACAARPVNADLIDFRFRDRVCEPLPHV